MTWNSPRSMACRFGCWVTTLLLAGLALASVGCDASDAQPSAARDAQSPGQVESVVDACIEREMCLAGPLDESNNCQALPCVRREQLTNGCIGSHVEQPCESCGVTYTRADAGDYANLYFDADGTLVAVEELTDAGPCSAMWFGKQLSDCAPLGPEVRVLCDPQGP